MGGPCYHSNTTVTNTIISSRLASSGIVGVADFRHGYPSVSIGNWPSLGGCGQPRLLLLASYKHFDIPPITFKNLIVEREIILNSLQWLRLT